MSWNVGIIKKRLNLDSTILLQDQVAQPLDGWCFEIIFKSKLSTINSNVNYLY